MSKGPGRIERAIEAAFAENPGKTFSVGDLAPIAYPGVNLIEKKHRVSILRAANKVAARGAWSWGRAERPGGEVIYSNLTNVRSYRLGMLRRDNFTFFRHTPLEELEARLDDPSVRDSEWAAIQPGGVWALHVEIHKADLRGDAAEGERLRAELGRGIAAKYAAYQAKYAGRQ